MAASMSAIHWGRFAPLLTCCLLLVSCASMRELSARMQQWSAQKHAAPPAARADLLVSSDWLAYRLADPQVRVLHIARERAGYEAGHIPGASPVLWKELTTTRGGIPNELPSLEQRVALVRRLGLKGCEQIVIYDEDAGLEAAWAYMTLESVGLGDRSALLDGQLKKWRAERRPLSKIEPKPAPSSFLPCLLPGRTLTLSAMCDLVWAKNGLPGARVTLIDARPPEQFSGAEPGEGIARPGHIPGAINFFWQENLVSKDWPILRPPEQLRQLYAQAGISQGTRLAVYCRTGVQAAFDYFVLKYLGYQPELYDGSYFEWARAEGTPVIGNDPAKPARKMVKVYLVAPKE